MFVCMYTFMNRGPSCMYVCMYVLHTGSRSASSIYGMYTDCTNLCTQQFSFQVIYANAVCMYACMQLIYIHTADIMCSVYLLRITYPSFNGRASITTRRKFFPAFTAARRTLRMSGLLPKVKITLQTSNSR